MMRNLYVISVTKPRSVRSAVRVAHMGEMKNAYRILIGKLEEGDRGRFTLKCILKK
jgi:hypothetical protein